MRTSWPYFLAIIFLIFSCGKEDSVLPEEKPVPVNENFLLAAYLPAYSFSRLDPNALKKLHRIYYFSVAPDNDGNFVYSQADITNLNVLKKHYAGTEKQIYLVIGGWYESETIHAMARSESKRKKYASDIAEFCRQQGLQGVDLDWESYPEKVDDANYSAWVKELYAELKSRGLGFTTAVDVAHTSRSAALIAYVDQLNLMSYGIMDAAGDQASFGQMINWLAAYRDKGIPNEKLIVGVPFYAQRPYEAGNTTARTLTYRTVLTKITPAPNINRYEKYGFNGQTLLQTKTRYLMQNNYYGIMAWEMTQDVPVDSPYSLLRAIYEEYSVLLKNAD